MNNEEFLWSQKYRPKTIKECILPDDIKNTFQKYVDNKEVPNLILSGTQGSGKTTSILAMCNEIGLDYLFINGSSETGIDVFRNKITNYASSVSLSGGRKVVIIDEAEYMNSSSLQPALRAGIEEFSKNATFVLTCNNQNKIIQPIHSRCAVIKFTVPKGEKKTLLVKFFKRVCNILDNERIVYDKEVIANFIAKWYPDNRRILNELQRYSVNGKIDLGLLTQIGDIQLKDLITYLKIKDFGKVREWVAENHNNDPNTIYRKLYDGMYSFLTPNSIPQLVLIIAKYQYQSGFACDQEINLLAFMVEVMTDCQFK